MNSFLVTTLVISGVVDLAVAGWAMAAFSRGTERNPLTVALALAALGAAALIGLTMRWIQKEKQEAYPLSITLGSVSAAAGLGTFAAGGFHSFLPLGYAAVGLILGIFGVVAMNAPSVITDLRIPASRDQRQPLRRGAGRDRDPQRGDRDLDRRRGRGGREGRRSEGPRGARPPRDASIPARAAGPDRAGERPERRERPDRPERGPLRGDRPDRGERGDRADRDRRRRPPVAEPTDGRGLSVVVSGTPPVTVPLPNRPIQDMPRVQRPETPPIEERLAPRPGAVPPRPRIEMPPMRPLRPDVPPGEAGDPVDAPAPVEERRDLDRDGDRDRDRDRSRGRRRRGGRGGSRSGFGERQGDRGASPGEERPAASAGEEREEEAPPRPRYEPVAPSEPRPFEPRPFEPAEPRAYQPPEPVPSAGPIGPIGPIDPVESQEPIDRISGFSERPAASEPRSTPQPAPEFGRIKKPVLAGRRGKHSKPRENRSHKGLGSSIGGDVAGEPSASSEPMRRIAPEGRVGMSDGIGPVDLSESGADNDD